MHREKEERQQAETKAAKKKAREIVKEIKAGVKGKGVSGSIEPETTRPGGRPPGTDRGSVRDIAAKTGIDRNSIRRDLNRGRKLGVDTLTKLKNTSLDQAGELDALVALSAIFQKQER